MSSDQGVAPVDEPPQEIFFDVVSAAERENLMKSVKAHALLQRSNTENWIARTLVIAIIVSLPVMLILMWLGEWSREGMSDKFQSIFERWLTLVGPLAGAAVGVGAMAKSGDGTDG